MLPYIIIGSVLLLILVFIPYLFTTMLLKKSFKRLDFTKDSGLIAYEDISNKYPRTEYQFKSGCHTLNGYLYGDNKGSDLVVYVHGLCPGHQGYLSEVIALVDLGYAVFTYDFTGTGASSGKSFKGLDQQLFDIKKAMRFLKNQNYFGYQNIYLDGHSMGGYAVGAYYNPDVKASVSISGFNDPIEELMYYFSKGKSKLFIFLAKYMINLKYFIDRGFGYCVKAHKRLHTTKTKTLVIHGSRDEVVPFDISICNKKGQINNDLVDYYIMEEELHSSHNSVIASTECVLYQKEISKIYDEQIKLGKTPKEARQIAFTNLDVFKYNQANLDLMDRIDKFYKKAKQN